MKQVLTAGVVRAAPLLCDMPATVAKLAGFSGNVAGQGANRVVLPRAFVSGARKVLTHRAIVAARLIAFPIRERD